MNSSSTHNDTDREISLDGNALREKVAVIAIANDLNHAPGNVSDRRSRIAGHVSSTPFQVRDAEAFAKAFDACPFGFGPNVGVRILDRQRNVVSILGSHEDICGMPRARLRDGRIGDVWCDEEDLHDAMLELFTDHIISRSLIFTSLAYDGADRIETRITINGSAEGISITARRTRHSLDAEMAIHSRESWPISISTHEVSNTVMHGNVLPFSRDRIRAQA